MAKFQINQIVIYVPEMIMAQVNGFAWIQTIGEPPMIGAYELSVGITVPETFLKSVEEGLFTHIHTKTGGKYRMIRECKIEQDWVDAVVYESADGLWIVRPLTEFNERFEKI